MKKILVVLSVSVFAYTAKANTIVFNTLGPGDTYDQNLAYSVVASPGVLIEIAAQFTALASGNLASVDLGLTHGATQGGPVNAYLYGNATGSPDNANQTLLGSGTPNGSFGATNNSLVSITVAGSVPVTMGTTYWLVLKPGPTTTGDGWNYSSPGVAGRVDDSTDNSTWSLTGTTLPAFRLTASSGVGAPDSGSTLLLMLGSGMALLCYQRIFQRRQAN